MENCIFCQIVAGESPAYKIYEDHDYLAFLDIYPKVVGHTLIIPIIHYRYVWDMPQPGDLLTIARKLVRHFEPLLKTQIFYTQTLGELVRHAHFHLLPQNVSLSLSLAQLSSLLSTT